MGGLSFFKDSAFPGWSLACVCFASSLGREQEASLPLFPEAPAAEGEAGLRDPHWMSVVPVRRWLGGWWWLWSGTASGPSSLSIYFWIHSSFKGQNLFWNHFLHPAPLWEVGVCRWMPRLGGAVWGPSLCLNGRSLITSIHLLQKPGDGGLPPTCCREMKGFAESFECHGGTL